jgi:hypothetical protein
VIHIACNETERSASLWITLLDRFASFKASKIKLAVRRAGAQIFCPLALYREVSGIAGASRNDANGRSRQTKATAKVQGICPAAAREGRGGGLGGEGPTKTKVKTFDKTIKQNRTIKQNGKIT